MNISWIVGLIIVLLFVVSASFAFYSDEGVFARFKTSYVSFKESAPNVSLGADKLKTDKPSIDELHDSEIDNLKEAIEKMVGSNKNCFQSYAGFTPLDDVSVKFTSEDEVTYVDVFSQGRFVADSSFKFNGSLCVIAGDDVVVKNFATSFLNKNTKKSIANNHFYSVNELSISYSDGGALGTSGNVIRVPEFGDDKVNDVNNNLEDAGLIYTPDGEHICFFPTVLAGSISYPTYCYLGEVDEDGLDNDCLGADYEEVGVPYQYNKNLITHCK